MIELLDLLDIEGFTCEIDRRDHETLKFTWRGYNHETDQVMGISRAIPVIMVEQAFAPDDVIKCMVADVKRKLGIEQ